MAHPDGDEVVRVGLGVLAGVGEIVGEPFRGEMPRHATDLHLQWDTIL